MSKRGGSPVPRLHLFELEDQPWVPASVRGWLTDCLRLIFGVFVGRTNLAAKVARVLRHTGEDRILDLCSGSSGPWVPLLEALESQQGLQPRVRLSDKFPNLAAYAELEARSGGRIDYVDGSLDARDVPSTQPGIRTMIAGFHHFRPADARDIVEQAVDEGRGLAIFEVSERCLPTLLMTPLVGLSVLALTPLLRPSSLGRFVFTYLVPIVPLFVFWDGLASCCRSYTVAELQELASSLERPGYRFEVARERIPGLPVHLISLLGFPEPNGEESLAC